MVHLQNLHHARQLLPKFFNGRGCPDLTDVRLHIRRYREEAEAETMLWGEIIERRRLRRSMFQRLQPMLENLTHVDPSGLLKQGRQLLDLERPMLLLGLNQNGTQGIAQVFSTL